MGAAPSSDPAGPMRLTAAGVAPVAAAPSATAPQCRRVGEALDKPRVAAHASGDGAAGSPGHSAGRHAPSLAACASARAPSGTARGGAAWLSPRDSTVAMPAAKALAETTSATKRSSL